MFYELRDNSFNLDNIKGANLSPIKGYKKLKLIQKIIMTKIYLKINKIL